MQSGHESGLGDVVTHIMAPPMCADPSSRRGNCLHQGITVWPLHDSGVQVKSVPLHDSGVEAKSFKTRKTATDCGMQANAKGLAARVSPRLDPLTSWSGAPPKALVSALSVFSQGWCVKPHSKLTSTLREALRGDAHSP